MDNSLEKIFNPSSIAIVGASETPGKAAERRTRSLLEGGYGGKIFLINPKREMLFGRKTYPSLSDVPEQVDLVMIVIPAPLIPNVIGQCVEKGAKGAIIITAGLGETGKEGKEIESQILENAAKGNVRIIGPNCSGMYSRSAQMNLLGVPPIKPGPVAIIAQSGNIIDSLTHYAKVRGIGFSKIISAGNAIGVKFHEYVEYLGNDPDTKVICIYMEGISEGDKLVIAARKVTRKKPIIILKVGRSGAGARAAASHTGSLAADDKIVQAAFQQAGILRVTNVDSMFDLAECFSLLPLPKGRRVAILSEGGGDNSVAADNAESYGLEVPVLSEATQEKIRPFLLKGMPAQNPIDYGGTAEENPHMITECCKVCMETDEVDALYITGFFGGFKEIIAPHVETLEIQTAKDLTNFVKKYQKPLVMHTSFAHEPFESIRILKENGIPVFSSSERAAFCLGAMAKAAERIHEGEGEPVESLSGKRNPLAAEILGSLERKGIQNVLETEAREILKAYNIQVPEAYLAKTPEEAAQIAEKMGFPIAIKIVSRKILHKSDVGGVKINLSTPTEVTAAYQEIMENVARSVPKDDIEGILITPMAPEGQECIVGMTRNPQFGPVIMFGLGGIFVEVLRDVTFRIAPLSPKDADEMIRSIKGYPILQGIRGQAPKDIGAILDILLGISRLAVDNPEIAEMDLNPVIVHEKGASIVDARMILG